MTHPLVAQLRFVRRELLRALAGLSDDEARRRFLPMNCISWNIGHLAWQEQRYWLTIAQGVKLKPELNAEFAYGRPATTPPLAEILQSWREITTATDAWLDAVTTEKLTEQLSLIHI